MDFLPSISKAVLKNTQNDWEYIDAILNPFQQAIEDAPDEEEMLEKLTDTQFMPLVYSALYGEVCNGGFLQLILNGYANYAMDPAFIEGLTDWGLTKTAVIVQKARSIYEQNQVLLDQDLSVEEISALYKSFTHFEILDDDFYETMDDEVTLFRKYIENHLNQFILLID